MIYTRQASIESAYVRGRRRQRMDIAQTGLHKQPFHAYGRPVVFVPYHAQLTAFHFLQMILDDDRGVGVFYGPVSSGKKTIASELVRNMPADIPVAVVDAARSKTLGLLTAIMSQLDPGPAFDSVDGYWYALRIFLAEKTRTGQTPLLIVQNINKMYPSALYALCKLAELRIGGQYLLRMILMSDHPPFAVIRAPTMAAVAKRSIGAFEMGPMTLTEAYTYVHAKLRASGCENPETLFSAEIIERLFEISGGWPGKLDGLAMQAIQRTFNWPSANEAAAPRPEPKPELDDAQLTPVAEPVDDPGIQKLFLTFNRKTLQEIDLSASKTLIGRSGLCDITIDSRFVSKCHAILIRTDRTLHLLDLNSSNGTFVNSKRIQNRVLRHDDVISIGNHGIKLICPAYRSRPAAEDYDLADTAAMKTLPEMRRLRDAESDSAAPGEKQGS